jgi:glycosyltransferase involved in cell wall biosynthesis
MSRFPKLSETFVLYEMLAVERLGVAVDVYPLLRERASVVHPEAAPLVERARYEPFFSWPILRSQLLLLRDRPRRYLGALWTAASGTFGSLNFFVGALGIFAKVAHMALRMEAEGVTHVHCHFASHPAVAGLIVHRLTGIPFSFTAHGSDLHKDRRMLCRKVSEAVFVVAISDYNRRMILDECHGRFADRVIVIHCGVDTDVFAAPERPPEGRLGLLCIGTLHEVKGQTVLVEACRRLSESGVDFVCRLVGDGPDRGRLTRQIAAAGLDERVLLEGSRTRAEVAALLRSADILVAPSVPTRSGKREGIPVVLMEGLASGVAVVASEISGIPELVVDGVTGLLVPPGDPAALAAALERLGADRLLRRRLGLGGREKVAREFNLETTARELAVRFAGATL